MAGYCKLGDIEGESKDDSHDGWINLMATSQQLTRPMRAGASGSTRQRASVTCGDVLLTKELDASSPKIIEAICDGTVFPEVLIDLCTSTGAEGRIPYFQWEMVNVYVSDYHVSGATTDGQIPVETFALNFEEVKWTYDKMGKDGQSTGKVEATWKVEEGVK